MNRGPTIDSVTAPPEVRWFDVEGLAVRADVSRATRALTEVPGVTRAIVTLAPPRARVDGTADLATLQSAAAGAGVRLIASDGPTSVTSRPLAASTPPPPLPHPPPPSHRPRTP